MVHKEKRRDLSISDSITQASLSSGFLLVLVIGRHLQEIRDKRKAKSEVWGLPPTPWLMPTSGSPSPIARGFNELWSWLLLSGPSNDGVTTASHCSQSWVLYHLSLVPLTLSTPFTSILLLLQGMPSVFARIQMT